MFVGKTFNPFQIFVGSFIPNCLLRSPILTPVEKLLWARLAQFAGQDGECYPKQETIATELAISVDRVGRLLANLEEKSFILKINPTGVDRLKHLNNRYKFLWHPIFETGQVEPVQIAAPDSAGIAAPGSGLPTSADKENHEKEINTLSQLPQKPGRNRPAPIIKPPHDPDKEAAHKLALYLLKIIRSHQQCLAGADRIKGWIIDIKNMIKIDGLDYERIHTALAWYSLNIGGEYIPQIFSGRALREKFQKLEAAIKRSGWSSDGPKQNRHEGKGGHEVGADEVYDNGGLK